MEGSLGAFATSNQCSVENLENQMKQKNMLVRKLQYQMMTMERDVQNKMRKEFKQVIVDVRHQIQQWKANLDELHKKS